MAPWAAFPLPRQSSGLVGFVPSPGGRRIPVVRQCEFPSWASANRWWGVLQPALPGRRTGWRRSTACGRAGCRGFVRPGPVELPWPASGSPRTAPMIPAAGSSRAWWSVEMVGWPRTLSRAGWALPAGRPCAVRRVRSPHAGPGRAGWSGWTGAPAMGRSGAGGLGGAAVRVPGALAPEPVPARLWLPAGGWALSRSRILVWERDLIWPWGFRRTWPWGLRRTSPQAFPRTSPLELPRTSPWDLPRTSPWDSSRSSPWGVGRALPSGLGRTLFSPWPGRLIRPRRRTQVLRCLVLDSRQP